MAKGAFHKKKSKRTPLKTKYKVQKKVKEHLRKLKKGAKGKPKASKKDPGVPNECPFKDEILLQIKQQTEREDERREQMKSDNKKRQKEQRQAIVDKKRNATLTTLATSAAKRQETFNKTSAILSSSSHEDPSRKAYYREVKKVIEKADVVIEVLDARDPLGSRCPQVENAILADGSKRLILLLNKIDLVPRENVDEWLAYLRHQFPTVAFKASTQTQKENLGHFGKHSMKADFLDNSFGSKCVGASVLLALLGNYSRSGKIRTAITVGIVGFPNVGKSSVINSLKRSRVCNVGSTPGITKTSQPVRLDKKVRLLDSPGVILSSSLSEEKLFLRNCISVNSLKDLISPVETILRCCHKELLMVKYKLPDYKTTDEFLREVGKKKGCMSKGGVVNVNRAAKYVLQDWLSGKISYITRPPPNTAPSVASVVSTKIVNQWKKEFNVNDLLEKEALEMKKLSSLDNMDGVVIPCQGMTDGFDENVCDEVDEVPLLIPADASMDSDADSKIDDDNAIAIKITQRKTSRKIVDSEKPVLKGRNVQLNKARKVQQKRKNKEKKRQEKVTNKLSETFSTAMEI